MVAPADIPFAHIWSSQQRPCSGWLGEGPPGGAQAAMTAGALLPSSCTCEDPTLPGVCPGHQHPPPRLLEATFGELMPPTPRLHPGCPKGPLTWGGGRRRGAGRLQRTWVPGVREQQRPAHYCLCPRAGLGLADGGLAGLPSQSYKGALPALIAVGTTLAS